MGGSSNKTNRNITLGGATGTSASAGNLASLGSQNNSQGNQLYNMLWGSSPTQAGGVLGPIVAGGLPSSPTGNFAIANTKENEAAQTASENEGANIKQEASNAGFGSNAPAGFTQDQLRQNENALATQEGSNFNTNTQNSANNFWNATGMANNDQNAAAGRAISATQGAGQLYNNLFSNASKLPGGGGGSGQLGSGKSSLMGGVQGGLGSLASGLAA